jgi:hypothetical protein
MNVKLFITLQKPFCPLFRKIAHFSGKSPPSEKNTRFGAEKKSEIVPFFLHGPVTYPKCLFWKKPGSNWSTLALEGPSRIYTRI